MDSQKIHVWIYINGNKHHFPPKLLDNLTLTFIGEYIA